MTLRNDIWARQYKYDSAIRNNNEHRYFHDSCDFTGFIAIVFFPNMLVVILNTFMWKAIAKNANLSMSAVSQTARSGEKSQIPEKQYPEIPSKSYFYDSVMSLQSFEDWPIVLKEHISWHQQSYQPNDTKQQDPTAREKKKKKEKENQKNKQTKKNASIPMFRLFQRQHLARK